MPAQLLRGSAQTTRLLCYGHSHRDPVCEYGRRMYSLGDMRDWWPGRSGGNDSTVSHLCVNGCASRPEGVPSSGVNGYDLIELCARVGFWPPPSIQNRQIQAQTIRVSSSPERAVIDAERIA
jgi:hypothetical protein